MNKLYILKLIPCMFGLHKRSSEELIETNTWFIINVHCLHCGKTLKNVYIKKVVIKKITELAPKLMALAILGLGVITTIIAIKKMIRKE